MEGRVVNAIDGISERFVPEHSHGKLVEAEHLVRYWWASRLVKERRVLDAGCGVAYGSSILAAAGATEVVGIDIDEGALDSARPHVHPNVRLSAADIRQLPFEDASFEAIVCFETIEHLEAPELAFDELARVLTEDGLLIVSSPNRDVYPPGNAHHHHEFLPDELRDSLAERFANVRLFRQHDWFTAAVFDDNVYGWEDQAPLARMETRKVVGREPGTELYTVALASNARLPRPIASAVLTHTAELRELSAGFEELERGRAEFTRLEEEQATLEKRVARAEAASTESHRRAREAAERLLELETRVALLLEHEHQLEESYAAQEQELTEQVRTIHSELERVTGILTEMEDTRVWRFGQRFWRFKAALTGRSRRT